MSGALGQPIKNLRVPRLVSKVVDNSMDNMSSPLYGKYNKQLELVENHQGSTVGRAHEKSKRLNISAHPSYMVTCYSCSQIDHI